MSAELIRLTVATDVHSGVRRRVPVDWGECLWLGVKRRLAVQHSQRPGLPAASHQLLGRIRPLSTQAKGMVAPPLNGIEVPDGLGHRLPTAVVVGIAQTGYRMERFLKRPLGLQGSGLSAKEGFMPSSLR